MDFKEPNSMFIKEFLLFYISKKTFREDVLLCLSYHLN